MNRISRRKVRFIIVATALLCPFLLIFAVIWTLDRSLRHYTAGRLATYISQNYMVDQQEATGKWPNTLNGFPKYLRKRAAEEPGTSNAFLMQQALDAYRKRFVKFEIVKKGKVRYIYRVSTMDGDFLCYSSTEGDASCQDAKSSQPFVFYIGHPDGHETTVVIDNSTVDDSTPK